jgi:signal transduction histidine kinase
LGLVTALETLAREVGAQFSMSGQPAQMQSEKALALYRIAQEALNNARHHAQADNIRVELEFDQNQATLRVCDDGIGFMPPPQLNDLTRTGHFGLMGMRERAQLVGGKVSIDASPGKGTSVTFTLAV